MERLKNANSESSNVVDSFLAQRIGNTAMNKDGGRILSTEEIEKYAKSFHEEEVKDAPRQINKVAKEIKELELDYRKQVDRAEERDLLHIPESEFLLWESDYADLWREIENQKLKGGLDSYQEAKAEEPMFFTQDESLLSKTIEAQSGIFYAKREEELLDAIREQGNNEEDYEYARSFAKSVFTHLDYKYMSASEISQYGYNQYEKERTRVHNNAIKHLNGLNHLAEKYGTKRFTPRDFWTSEVPVSQQTDSMAKRMRYDRDLVEEYYKHAFRGENEKRKAAQERALRNGFGY